MQPERERREVRAYRSRDLTAVLGLIDADRLAGHRPCSADELAGALAGVSTVDAEWWAELEPPGTDVLERTGGVAGLVSYAVRPRDHTGVLLWLHGREDSTVVAALLAHALARLAGRVRRYEAYTFPSPGRGLDGLPVLRRPVTHRALLDAGFTDRLMGTYRRGRLAVPPGAQPRPGDGGPEVVVIATTEPAGWRLELRDSERQLVGEAIVGAPVDGVGELWWIGVRPASRGQGFGRRLLASAMRLLARSGAREVLLFVDDDEPGGQRDRTAANRLYGDFGLAVVDQVRTYERSGG